MVRRSGTGWFTGDDRFIELMEALSAPDDRWMQPEGLDILTALDELMAWANDRRDYDERIHKSGWNSAINDFNGAVRLLGRGTFQVVRSHVNAIRVICQPNIGASQTLRAKLSSECRLMRQTLADGATVTAAWDDLRRVCSRKESPMTTVGARRDNFWAIVRAMDRNTVELSRALSSVLTGDPVSAVDAKLQLREIDGSSVDIRSLRDAPLIDPAERLRLVVALLDVEATSNADVVWFAFRRAFSDTMGRFGPIQFFDAQWLRGNLFEDGPLREQLPGELADLREADSIPDKNDVVLARIDLGVGIFPDAVRVAGEQLETLLGISTIDCSVPWEQLSGFIHARNGRIVSHSYFIYEEEDYLPYDAMRHTAAEISHMAPLVIPMLPVRDAAIKEIIDSLHWWRAGSSQPTAAAIVLNVRAIELLASRVGETSWTTYLEKYLKNLWIRESIVDTLYLALREALHGRVAPEDRARQRQIFLEAYTYERGRQGFRIGAAARHLDAIIDFIPSGSSLGRELRTVKRRTSDGHAIQAWCAEMERQWAGWVHRLERIRNSIAHGGPFTESAVRLTQPFSRRVSAWALSMAVDGLVEGKSVAQSHADRKSLGDGWRFSMQSASSIGDLIETNQP